MEFLYILASVITGYLSIVKFCDLQYHTRKGDDRQFMVVIIVAFFSSSTSIYLFFKFIKMMFT